MERWKSIIEKKKKKKSRERLGKWQEGGGQKKKNRCYLLQVLGRGVNIKALIMVSYFTHTSTHQNLELQHLQQNSTSLPPAIYQHQLVNSAFLWVREKAGSASIPSFSFWITMGKETQWLANNVIRTRGDSRLFSKWIIKAFKNITLDIKAAAGAWSAINSTNFCTLF